MATISKEDLALFEKVKESNPYYYEAMLKSASIMPTRRDKYSGTGDPYTNFKLVHFILQEWFKERVKLDMRDVFAFYNALKFARYVVSGNIDYEDESGLDSRRDGANYYLLDMGDMLRNKEEK